MQLVARGVVVGVYNFSIHQIATFLPTSFNAQEMSCLEQARLQAQTYHFRRFRFFVWRSIG
jgi:hypothetical protein